MSGLPVDVHLWVHKVSLHSRQSGVAAGSVVGEYVHEGVSVSQVSVQSFVRAIRILSTRHISMRIQSPRVKSSRSLLVEPVSLSVRVHESIGLV